MKRAILCEVCRHQTCVFNALLHRQAVTCAVRPGVIAEQVIYREFDGKGDALSAYIGNLPSSTKVAK